MKKKLLHSNDHQDSLSIAHFFLDFGQAHCGAPYLKIFHAKSKYTRNHNTIFKVYFHLIKIVFMIGEKKQKTIFVFKKIVKSESKQQQEWSHLTLYCFIPACENWTKTQIIQT